LGGNLKAMIADSMFTDKVISREEVSGGGGSF
jgi:hypothetical protein